VRDAQLEQAGAERGARPWRDVFRRRVFVGLAVLAIWISAVIGRLVHVQVLQRDTLVTYLARQVADTEVLPGLRGRILDRHGATLAVTVHGDVIAADPQVVTEPGQKPGLDETVARVCGAIAGCRAADRDRMASLLRARTRRRYVVLWRDASPADAQRITELRIRGVFLDRESRRFYPNRDLASHVIGHVDEGLHGLTGVEYSQDANIRGRDGKRLVFRDGRRHGFDSLEQPATMGAAVELTIDRTLQLIAERELAAGIREYNAKGAVAIILDPWTGEILAAANAPTFNPNAFTEQSLAHQRNRAAQDLYEPGSTFKIVTASTAIDTKTFTPDTPVNVAGGSIRIGARVVRDVHAYAGTLSARDVIVKSSNVGAIRMGLEIGARRIAEYARLFGFGWLTARDLPFSSRGAILKPEDSWSASAVASVSMGYQVGVSPMQMAAAASTIANGGVLYQPHVVRALIVNGERRPMGNKPLHRVISEETAATMTSIMEAVVEQGTGKASRIPGYTVAGKTGTARKVAEGRRGYTDEYNASFVGFIPSRDPVFTILVVVDSPKGKGYYGGAVAAPIFRRIAEAALRYQGISPNVDPSRTDRALLARADAGGARLAGGAIVPATPASVTAADVAIEDVPAGSMPNLRNVSAREAVRRLTRLGLGVRLAGRGVVVQQDIPPGTAIEPGLVCGLVLEARPRPLAPPGTEP
jgi:cell division protein FtsI/penicillin-binding protein 2